jgi:predicted nucleic acid-binding protein
MIPRIYIDTSVIGGCLDDEFSTDSNRLLEMANNGKAVLLISDLLIRELDDGPPQVRAILKALPSKAIERIFLTSESDAVFEAYIRAGILGDRHANDARHIALATVAKADLVLSWNFKHIVHWDKIRMFNSVNLREGYPQLEIRSPLEYV